MQETGLIDLIHARRSIRKYTGEPVGENDVEEILDAAMAARHSSPTRR